MGKIFEYIGKDYINREYVERYERVSRWIEIKFTTPKKEDDSKAYFRHDNRRYYLDNFLRVSFPVIVKDKTQKEEISIFHIRQTPFQCVKSILFGSLAKLF